MPRLFDVRGGEGRAALLGFALVLLLIITGHTILEAARDALLLAGPGPRALGLVYVAIAVCAWPAAALASRASERFGPKRSLAGTLAVAAALPACLFLAPSSTASSVAVYVVSGLIGSIVVPQFWMLVGIALTAAQGRRLFGLIAAAGVLGGVVGSGAASAALLVLPVKALLLLSTVVFSIAVVGVHRVRAAERAPRPRPSQASNASESLRAFRSEPLLAHIAAAVVLSTATLLVLDYCFKSAVSRTIPSERIGSFVARYYLALNALSFVVQLLLSSAIVRRLGVTRAIVLTPALLLLAAIGVIAGGAALVPVLVMKAIDGGLRFSIHRITGELMYLPVTLHLRQRLKPLIDGALARASQTATGASLLAVSGTWLVGPRSLAVIVTVLAVAWLAVVVTMRRPYLARLRNAISSGTLHTQDDPEPLDLESAQLLVQHLASEDPLEVTGAMNALCRRGHVGFVPALVLLHTDEGVLDQALDHFGASTRTDWIPLARRLLGDGRESVRMAAARGLAMHDALDLDRLTHDVGWRVRGYAAVDSALRDGAEDALEHEVVAALLRETGDHGASARLGMLAAIADAPPTPALARLLLALGAGTGGSGEHTELLARAASRQRDARLVPCLVERLASRDGREAVRTALVAFGEDGLDAVWWALRDTRRPRSFRIHVPKTLARFGTRLAAEHLLENVETEEDGLVRYKSILALEILVRLDGVAVDRARIEKLAQAALLRHFWVLGARAALGEPSLQARSSAERLLAGLLDDKVRQSLERCFRLLAIAHPREDFHRLRIACLSDDPYTRSNAGELLDALMRRGDEQRLRALLRLVTDDLPAPERVARAAPLIAHRALHTREEALAALAHDRDATVAALAQQCTGGDHRAPATERMTAREVARV